MRGGINLGRTSHLTRLQNFAQKLKELEESLKKEIENFLAKTFRETTWTSEERLLIRPEYLLQTYRLIFWKNSSGVRECGPKTTSGSVN